ncbi:MAG: murein transglycosylase A [Nostocaceae cyanobacterium]|nr:murein transglycosylase A [Nostocaceae cyanobacterium]
MRKTLAFLALGLGIAVVTPVLSAGVQVPSGFAQAPYVVPTVPLPAPTVAPPVEAAVPPPLKKISLSGRCVSRNCLGWDEQLWGSRGDRQALLQSIDNSLSYLATPKAAEVYSNNPTPGITRARVQRSLLRFRQLVVTSRSSAQLQAAVRREFDFYKSIGNDGRGTVLFTAYYEPIYSASRVPTPEYRYPLYRLPANFEQWTKPHPRRVDLEGLDGLLGDNSPLRGLELYWFRSRLDAYMVHIQGSAQLQFSDGTTTSVGFAGGTDYPWTSIGKELLKDGKVARNQLTLPGIVQFFQTNPQEMSNYLPRWERFVFFKDTNGTPASGSINVPVTPERSIATDKSLMPPGALALVRAPLPFPTRNGMVKRTVDRFVLDQDTGSAIRGPGRVDYFMGTGKIAGDRAGITGGNGQLYYLLLKN